jgi:hypothetical protein
MIFPATKATKATVFLPSKIIDLSLWKPSEISVAGVARHDFCSWKSKNKGQKSL